jgi:hypothetical protein
MERDFDLIRLILKDIQATPAGRRYTSIENLSAYDPAVVCGHIDLLIDAGLVKGKVTKMFRGADAILVSGLTWKGYDFLEAAKDDNLWNKAKEKVIKPGVSFTFDLLLEWLKGQARVKLGLS